MRGGLINRLGLFRTLLLALFTSCLLVANSAIADANEIVLDKQFSQAPDVLKSVEELSNLVDRNDSNLLRLKFEMQTELAKLEAERKKSLGDSLITIAGLVIAIFAVGVGFEFVTMHRGVKKALKEIEEKKELLDTQSSKAESQLGATLEQLDIVTKRMQLESDKYNRVMRVTHFIASGDIQNDQLYPDICQLCEFDPCETVYSVVAQLRENIEIQKDTEIMDVLNSYWNAFDTA